MTTESVDALVAATPDGVALDGLEAARESDGYRFAVPGSEATGLSEAELRARAAEHEAYVHNWHCWTNRAPAGDDRRAFLRWIEDADERPVPERYAALRDGGVHATWGELRIGVSLADGERTYGLRHVDDADLTAGELDRRDDPLDARELAKADDRGRYRPLKTAPTLQHGWAFPDLTADELARAVDQFYPATISNWHREREGELDVDHWTATAQRQSGIYELIEELPREAVEWVAEACCVDSQCCKRREWQYDEDDELAVDGGDGVFPCREPCSVVIAAARQWTIQEGESERTYEFDLTPSEKHQLEELIDAVADGRVDEVREADFGDGANRYRARYLRAKRFDEDGTLCGTGGDE